MCGFSKASTVSLVGSGKGALGWFSLGPAQVYHDHFIAAQLENGVVIDFLREDGGVPVNVCLELSADSARDLAQAILSTLKGMAAGDQSR